MSTVVQATTHEQFKMLMTMFADKGYKWKSGQEADDPRCSDFWDTYADDTCIDYKGGFLVFCDYWHYKRDMKENILTFDEFRTSSFVKREFLYWDEYAKIQGYDEI